MNLVQVFEIDFLNSNFETKTLEAVVKSLESGEVVHFPKLPFELKEEETTFLDPAILKPQCKNISYDLCANKLKGISPQLKRPDKLAKMMKRFAQLAQNLVRRLVPSYARQLQLGRTSYRPIQAAGRVTSKRKDDTLLHVDSFPANPVNGNRILRVFTNINPQGQPRVWKVGESFPEVVEKWGCKVKPPILPTARLLQLLRMTKGYRSLYDHYMLKIHDAMKCCSEYQQNVSQQLVEFDAGTTWMVYTDQVSHAVVSGQYVLEQTFYLPPSAMKYEQLSPLRVLEKKLNRRLTKRMSTK